MWRVPVDGGAKKLVCDVGREVNGGRGAYWSADGLITFSLGDSGILTAPAVGGDAREIIAVNDSTEGDLHEPYVMPDGGLMFVVHPQGGPPGRLVIERNGERQVLLDYSDRRIWHPQYDGKGHIVFERDGTSQGIWALPYDAETGEVGGEPVLLIEGGARASVSHNGLLVHLTSAFISGNEQLVRTDRQGKVLEELTEILEAVGGPSVSPDGQRLAMSISEASEVDIWIRDLRRGTRQRLPNPEAVDFFARWTTDGREVFFYTMPPVHTIFRRSLDATAPLDTIVKGSAPNPSQDGRFLAYEFYPSSKSQVHILDLASGEDRALFVGNSTYTAPAISPDGALVSYISEETGEREAYLRDFADGGNPQRVSLDGAIDAKWSPDGTRLTFMNTDTMYEVSVGPGPEYELGPPVPLFSRNTSGLLFTRGYGLTHDGDGFIITRQGKTEVSRTVPELVAVDNWARLLEDR